MSRQLILHIGMPKCGSTYLQRILLKNRVELSAVGVGYPHDTPNLHPGNGSGFAEADTAKLDAAFGGNQRLILSHEDLFAQAGKAASLARAARELDVQVQVLAFIRPFSQFVFGDYSQNMKQNFDAYMKIRQPYAGRSFETFAVLRSQSLRPAQRFRNWLDVLSVEDAQEPGFTLANHKEIQQAVTPFLNGASMDWTLPVHEGNPSLRMVDCDTLAAQIRDTSIPAAAIVQERHEALRRAGSPDTGRTQERTAWIEAIFEKQNADLQEMFGYNNRINVT